MKKMVGRKQHDIKNANHRLILEQLRHKERLSRIELARNLSLSAPSISKTWMNSFAKMCCWKPVL